MSRQQRRARERRRGALTRKKHRRNTIAFWVVLGVLLAGAAIAVIATKHQTPDAIKNSTDAAKKTFSGPAGPEGIPLEVGAPLALLDSAATGAPVDNISCQPNEQAIYHVHSHLTVFVNGKLRPIPPGIGIVEPKPDTSSSIPFFNATNCFYWLHVHAEDGVIHVESPTQDTYTLGQFFDLWHQPLSKTQIASAKGKLTIYVNGKKVSTDPRKITLNSHKDIQIDVGKIVPPEKIDWGPSHL